MAGCVGVARRVGAMGRGSMAGASQRQIALVHRIDNPHRFAYIGKPCRKIASIRPSYKPHRQNARR